MHVKSSPPQILICRSVLFHISTKRDRIQEQPRRWSAVAAACFTAACLWGRTRPGFAGAMAMALRSGAGVPAFAGTPTLRSVRGIFRHVHAATKNDPFLSAAIGGGNQEGAPAPSWTLPRTLGRRTGVPGRLPPSIDGACCPARRGAALPAIGPLWRQDGRGRCAARRGRGTGDGGRGTRDGGA